MMQGNSKISDNDDNNSNSSNNSKPMKEFSVMVNSEEEAEQVQRDMQHATTQNIFRPVIQSKIHDRLVIILQWLFRKADKCLGMTSPEMRRWNRVHKFVKVMVVHNALRIIDRLLGKRYVLANIDGINDDWWNNHLRMFYQCWEDSTDDIFTKMNYPVTVTNHKNLNLKPPTITQYMDKVRLQRSHKSRLLLMRLWMTEVMEDTADRALMDSLMMRIYWTMHDHYKINNNREVPRPGKYPIYNFGKKCDPIYFYTNRNIPVWNNKLREVDEIGNNPRTKEQEQTNQD